MGIQVTATRGADQARLVKVGSGFGSRISVLRTQYRSQRFVRHSHDDYTLGLVLSGAGTFWCRGSERFAAEGDIVVIPPGEVHTGSVAADANLLSYLAIYLPSDLAKLHAATGARGGVKPPEFGAVVLRDPRVRRAFQKLDKVFFPSGDFRSPQPVGSSAHTWFDEGAAEEAVCIAITGLIARHAHHDRGNQRSLHLRGNAREPRIVRIVRSVLEDSYADPEATSLQGLASRTGVTPFQVIRSFRETTGLPPHQYLIQVRVERARQSLEEGVIPSMAALKAGFNDQSHLTYHFKKHLGITPGNYRRCLSVS